MERVNTFLLADLNNDHAEKAAEVLSAAGFEVSTTNVDVSSRTAVLLLIKVAQGLGDIVGLVQTAGVSPSQATPETILKVDLYGTAMVLEEFGKVITEGGSGIVIASQSGHGLAPLSAGLNKALAT